MTVDPLPSSLPTGHAGPLEIPAPEAASEVPPAVLFRLKWPEIEAAVAKEQKNRHVYTPSISVFRWWARRPHSLMGAIIDAANPDGKNDFVVSDIFSGGGTVGVEAARRGLAAYAQDLYPWPALGLKASLASCTLAEFDAAAAALTEHLRRLDHYYTREDGRVLSHIFYVREGQCPDCEGRVSFFPEHLVTQIPHPAKIRGKGKTGEAQETELSASPTEGYFGCQACGHVERRPVTDGHLPCASCGHADVPQRRGHTHKTCVHCGHGALFAAFLPGSRWKPVLVQEVKQTKGLTTTLRLPEDGDPLLHPLSLPEEVQVAMPDDLETKRLKQIGFSTWGDLYTPRQAHYLLEALRFTRDLDVSQACRDRLAYAVIGLAEMPAYLCRWDRFHQKVFEGFANHHYAHTTFVVETNFASPIGRGTLPRRLRAARKALAWALDTFPQWQQVRRVAVRPLGQCRPPIRGSCHIAIGSSVRQGLPDASVDLVLTDPPYFDDVQYGELSRLFHVWLAQYARLPKYRHEQEAVPNSARKVTGDDYQKTIQRSLAEARRTLKPGGKIILTFHNRKIQAWQALAGALRGAGLQVDSLAITRAENDADHSKRGGKGMLHDLVIECSPRTEHPGESGKPAEPPEPLIAHAGDSQEAQELRAVGLALARAVHQRSKPSLDTLFQDLLSDQDLKAERINS